MGHLSENPTLRPLFKIANVIRGAIMEKTVLEGNWIHDGKTIVGDGVCEQIERLLPGLTSIASREGGWTRLFRDPRSGEFWELTYPQSHLHGGGPPRLESLSLDQVHARYPYPDLVQMMDKGTSP